MEQSQPYHHSPPPQIESPEEAHLGDGFDPDDFSRIDPQGEFDGPEILEAEAVADVMTIEEFRAFFCDGFVTAGAFTGLQSVGIMPGERSRAEAAADALYRMAERYSWMRFLIGKQLTWAGDIIAIAMFAGPKVVAVRMEISARRAASKPKPTAGAAPDLGEAVAPDPSAGGFDGFKASQEYMN